MNTLKKSNKILIIWSNYYGDMAETLLENLIVLLKSAAVPYDIETLTAGTHEIPSVIELYESHHPYAAYIPLSILISGKTDHYDLIWQHIQTCFSHFALQGVIVASSCVITAPTLELAYERIQKNERTKEAVDAVSSLLKLRARLLMGHPLETDVLFSPLDL